MKHSAVIAVTREDDWLSLADLRALCDGRATLEEVSAAIEQEQGWRPSRAQIRAKLDRLGLSWLPARW